MKFAEKIKNAKKVVDSAGGNAYDKYHRVKSGQAIISYMEVEET